VGYVNMRVRGPKETGKGGFLKDVTRVGLALALVELDEGKFAFLPIATSTPTKRVASTVRQYRYVYLYKVSFTHSARLPLALFPLFRGYKATDIVHIRIRGVENTSAYMLP